MKEGRSSGRQINHAAGNLQIYATSIIQEKNRGRGQLEEFPKKNREKFPCKTRSSGIRSSSGFAGSPRASCPEKGACRAPRILKAALQSERLSEISASLRNERLRPWNRAEMRGEIRPFRPRFPPSFKLRVCYPFPEKRSTSNRGNYPFFQREWLKNHS